MGVVITIMSISKKVGWKVYLRDDEIGDSLGGAAPSTGVVD
jgi:hypothetical protein